MEEKLKIPFPVIVEGRYDRQTLSGVIEAKIITTDGFAVFKNAEKRALIRALSAKTKIILLTDPDGAGGVIRSNLCGMIPPERRIMLYVPRIRGRERRKKEDSAEGFLGVEGQDGRLLRRLFEPFASDDPPAGGSVTPALLYEYGLCGARDSAARRDSLGKRFGLPGGMSAKAFAAALGFLVTEEEFRKAAEESGEKDDEKSTAERM